METGDQGENDDEGNMETVEEGTENEDKENEANELQLQEEQRKLMEESNVRLKEALRSYTVIAIQSYLLETGAVTEIKDRLSCDFNVQIPCPMISLMNLIYVH